MMNDKKTQYNITIIIAAITFIFLYKIGLITEPAQQAKNEKPVFFERIPATTKKVRQHINIDIDYEKLPSRYEIRLIGRVNTSHIKADSIEYKWTLIDNLKLAKGKGKVSGVLNLRESNEIFLDVAIKDMNKKINVRLEAYAQGQKVKIGSVQNFIFDPSTEGKTIETAAEEKVNAKSISSELPKEQKLEKELFSPRSKKIQQ